MASSVEMAVATYIRAAAERDSDVRAQLLAACFSESGRFVTRTSVIHGRAGVDAMIARSLETEGRIVTIFVFAGPLAEAA